MNTFKSTFWAVSPSRAAILCRADGAVDGLWAVLTPWATPAPIDPSGEGLIPAAPNPGLLRPIQITARLNAQ